LLRSSSPRRTSKLLAPTRTGILLLFIGTEMIICTSLRLKLTSQRTRIERRRVLTLFRFRVFIRRDFQVGPQSHSRYENEANSLLLSQAHVTDYIETFGKPVAVTEYAW